MSAKSIKLEVCVDSIASALAAAEGGAARIELCSALSEGGLTPSVGTLEILKGLINIPIYCMLRPRRGNDFVYTKLEIDALVADMKLLSKYGADGFVFGALTPERTIDVETCQEIIKQANNLPVTYHRAFDVTNPLAMHQTVDEIKTLGFKRILTSGFRPSAVDGSEFLAQLIAKHHRDIIIMPGAGINIANLDDLLTTTKCIEFHASAKATAGSNYINEFTSMECDVQIGKQDAEPYAITDVNVVRKMVSISRGLVSG